MNQAVLGQYGIDPQAGLGRCMGSAELYERILGYFLKDASMAQARAALDSGDGKSLFAAVHTLKGACGNAGMTELFTAASALTELLRPGDADPNRITELFAKLETAYSRACEGIALALKG